MLRALGLRSGPTLSEDQKTEHIALQALQLENALKAMDYVLDDRAPEAFALLKDHDTVAISELAYGVCAFLEATLGFESETMKRASDILGKAESKSWKEKSFNEKNNIQASQIYPPGTEYAVAYAEANLLNALLMLLSENLMEAAKALLKLRRAYHTLDAISKSMEKMNGGELTTVAEAVRNLGLNSSASPRSSDDVSTAFADVPMPLTEQQLKDKEIIDKLDKVYKMRAARIGGSHIGNPPVSEGLRDGLGEDAKIASPDEAMEMGDPEVASVDEYIHSGVNLCFGILQVVLSLLPPALGRALSIIGFKGSREQGLKMLWKASQERNIHGGIALLALLVYYDGPFQFTDEDFDVPSTAELKALTAAKSKSSGGGGKSKGRGGRHSRSATRSSMASLNSTTSRKEIAEEKIELERKATRGDGEPTILHPGENLDKTLLHARALFPNSNLWLLCECRMLSSRGRLDEAVRLMDSAQPSEMKQVDAMIGFDRCTLLVFLHRFDRAGKEFADLINVNNYSHALYLWFAGSCYLEAWRMCETGLFLEGEEGKNYADGHVDPAKKETYKKLAEKYFLEAPKLVGKKVMIKSKVPPFEKMVARKWKEIEQRKKKTGLPLLDCIGASPVHELAYFWNGYNRMPEDCLELSVKLLGYSSDKIVDKNLDLGYGKFPEPTEDAMIRHTLQAVSLRRLGRLDEGERLIDSVIAEISETGEVDPSAKLKKLTANPWLYPTALYEKALFCWKQRGIDGLHDSIEWLRKSQQYGGDDYELSTRVGMKTKAALDRLEELEYD